MNQPRHFIYVLNLIEQYRKEANWTDEARQIVSSHFNYLKDLTDRGMLILAGRTAYEVDNDENFGIVVFEAESEEAARQIMDNDPAVKNGVMRATLHPYSLALLRQHRHE